MIVGLAKLEARKSVAPLRFILSSPPIWPISNYKVPDILYKKERFLPKNQHPQRKLLNFENLFVCLFLTKEA